MSNELPTVTLSVEEVAAISARAEVERTKGEEGVWSGLWARVQRLLKG